MQYTDLEGFRLSPQQERLWSLQQQGQIYWAYCSIEISGPLQEAWLYRAIQTICARHEIFRTRFCHLPGISDPLQVVEDQLQLAWHSYDLREADADQKQRMIEELERVAVPTPQKGMEKEALFYCTLLTLAEQQHILRLSASSLLADRGTLLKLVDELVQWYRIEQSGVERDSAEKEELQYLQFSEWQHSLLEEKGKADLQEIDFSLPPSFFAPRNVPFTTTREQTEQFVPAHSTILVDPLLWSSICSWLEQQNTSLPVFMLSCWVALLGRLCNDQEIPLCIQVDGRQYEDLTEVAGPLEKALPLLCQLDMSLPFPDLLLQVQEHYDHLLSLYPTFFSQAFMPAAQREAHLPISPFGFACGKLPLPYQMEALTFNIQECVCYSEPFALSLVVLQQSNQLSLQWLYHASLFSPSTIEQLAHYLLNLLQGILLQPQTPLEQLPLLNEAQRRHLLDTLAPGKLTTPPEQELFALIAQQGALVPDAIAVEGSEGQLSYQTLLRNAATLARALRARGIRPERLVGVYQKRRCALLVSLLAILQAGGAYIPLDPQTPSRRLQWIAEQAGANIILSDGELAEELSSWEGIEILTLERLLQENREDESYEKIVDEEIKELKGLGKRLAYVIYTSGSTGEPRGVMVSQQGLATYVCWASQHYEVPLGTGAIMHSSPAFDLSVTSLFTPLIVGRRVLLVEEAVGVEGLSRAMQEQGMLSLVKLTPAHLELLNQTLTLEEKNKACRIMVIGGEALSAASLKEWQRSESPPRLINEYGPTETVVGCCIYEVPPEGVVEDSVPIGRPISHTQLYILDKHQQPVPQGIVGELYIGGDTIVARGYLGQPGLTAERFVPHPFAQQAGERLYKTGDLARYKDEQGTLEYWGRVDRQVKLRGYRIELGEIEIVLQRHHQVKGAVVLLHEDKAGSPQLVAYIVPQLSPMPSFEELRNFMREYLPEYMVPSASVYVKSFPLNVNGKVDWQKLAVAEQDHDESIVLATNLDSTKQTIFQPRDEVEFKLLHIWEKLLPVSSISILDDFFVLGGHSMLAISLMSHISKQFGQDLPLDILFRASTIADLAIILRQRVSMENRSTLVAIQTRGPRLPFFCVHPSGGTVFCYLDLARHLGADQPFYGLQAPLPDTKADVFATVEHMAAYYITVIQAVQPAGPYLLGGWSMGGVVAFEMAQQLRRQGHDVPFLAIFDTRLANTAVQVKSETVEINIGDEEIARDMLHDFKITEPDSFAQLEPEKQLDWVVEQAKKSNALPADADLSYVRRIARIDKINNSIARLYVPECYQQRIDYFVAEGTIQSEEGNTKQEFPLADTSGKPDYVERWCELCGDAMKLHSVPGDHSEMIKEPNVQELAASLRYCIDEACKDL